MRVLINLISYLFIQYDLIVDKENALPYFVMSRIVEDTHEVTEFLRQF